LILSGALHHTFYEASGSLAPSYNLCPEHDATQIPATACATGRY
jgi:hypothetical protein